MCGLVGGAGWAVVVYFCLVWARNVEEWVGLCPGLGLQDRRTEALHPRGSLVALSHPE